MLSSFFSAVLIVQSFFLRHCRFACEKGQEGKRGGPLVKVGHLVGIKVPSAMLHLELYGTTESPGKTALK